MKKGLMKLREIISSGSDYDDEILEQIKNKPVYDLFTPVKSTIICESKEFHDLASTRFLGHDKKENLDVVKFFISLSDKDSAYLQELNPFKMYIRYNVEDENLPQYGKSEYKVNIHNHKVILNLKDLKEQDTDKQDLSNICDDNFPGIKIRGDITER